MRVVSEVNLDVPLRRRAAWVLLAAVGLAGLAFGGLLLAADARAIAHGDASGFGGVAIGGAGLFLVGFAALFLIQGGQLTAVRVGAAALTLEGRGGDRVDLPWTEVARVAAFPGQGDTGGWTVTVVKRDGGLLELFPVGARESADDMVGTLEAARVAAREGPAGSPPAPEAYLEHVAGVTAIRREGGLEFSWAATMPWRQLVFAGPVLGMAMIAFGFHRAQGGWGTLFALGFMGLVAGLLVVSAVRLRGTQQCIVVDGRAVTIERRRGPTVLESKSVPTFSLIVVDYTHRLNVIGANLNLRTQDAGGASASLDAFAEGRAPNPLDVARAVGALLKHGVQVPMGALSLPAKVAIDLALSAEVARRRGTSSSVV
ncbi:MAG: hypothetical protein AAF715_20800 [Myxococcota bacterium]